MTGSGEDALDPQEAPGADRARVTFVISGLVVGGAERVLTAIANGWVATGRAVAIVTLDRSDRPPFFPVDPRVELRRLGLAGVSHGPFEAIMNNARRVTRLRRAIEDTHPDVVVSFMDRTNVLTLLAGIGRRWPVIVADRTAADPRTGHAWRILRRSMYGRARWIVVQTQASALLMPPRLRPQTVAIPNPVLEPFSSAVPAQSAEKSADPKLAVSLGRLVPQKGYDLLLEAFASVVRSVPDARLEIWGDGPLAADLHNRVIEAGSSNHVHLAGETRDPATAIRRGGVFVLSSRIEGFPNVLLEAMALGKPVISFDCTFGPGEIIRDGVDGILVAPGDVDAMASGIVALMTDRERAAALGEAASEVRTRFGFAEILARWSRLVDGTAKIGTP